MGSARRILLVDDHPDDRALLRLVLERAFEDLHVRDAGDPTSFAEQLAAGETAAVIAEHRLSWSDGLGVLSAIKRADPDCLFVLFTGHGSEELVSDALEAGLDGYVVKGSAGYLRLPVLLRGLLARRAKRLAEQPFRRLAERIPIGAFSARPGQGIVDANAALARVLGYPTASALHGCDLADLLEDPEQRAALRAAVRDGEALGERIVRIRRRDPEKASGWIRLQVAPALDGPSGAYEGVVEDVTAHEESRRALAQEREALDQARKDVEELTYVVSHDLQAPLHISSRYALRLAERCKGERLDEEALRCVQQILTGTKRMQNLVDNVLAFSRVGTRGRPFAPIELSRAVELAMDNLRLELEDSGATVSCNGLPTVWADRLQMVQLFQNLLSNAVKFRNESPPHIEIGAAREDDQWLVSVRDDGIGIPKADHERIFEMFQRLHTAEEIPGTGIGLAICRRIVARHGGAIWVESVPAAGATFLLRLPAIPPGSDEAEPPPTPGGET